MNRDTCYYDGACGLCRRTTRLLRALDWLGRLDFRDLTRVPAAELPVPRERALEGMPMRTREGRVLLGFPAVRRALAQTPLGAPVAGLLRLPGFHAAGAAAYRRIASRRARDASCPPPARPYDAP